MNDIILRNLEILHFQMLIWIVFSSQIPKIHLKYLKINYQEKYYI